MTLPQESINEILEKSELSADFLSNDEAVSAEYFKGYKKGWQHGATEWAGKAQGPVSTLELLKIWLYECREHNKLLDIDKAISVTETALAKYKEVSNG